MTTLTSIEQILAEGLDPVYVVFALPEGEHFHPTDLPAPISPTGLPNIARRLKSGVFQIFRAQGRLYLVSISTTMRSLQR